MKRRNSLNPERDDVRAAIRERQGLLVGVLRCGRCGRRMHVRYRGRKGTYGRYLCIGDYQAGGRYCIAFGGGLVDRRFSEQLLAMTSPLGIKASLRALDELSGQDDERRQARARKVEQLDYEVQRAFEQYDEVDPRNRLVAAELERRWKRSGYRTAKDKRWNQTRVFTIRNRYSIPDSALDADVLHADAAARYCGVSVMAIRRLVAIGVLKCQQLVPYAPWKIRRSDLDSPALRSILERLKRTGRREIVGDGSHSQQRLLTEN